MHASLCACAFACVCMHARDRVAERSAAMSPPRQSTIAKFAAMAMAIHGSESFFLNLSEGVYL